LEIRKEHTDRQTDVQDW